MATTRKAIRQDILKRLYPSLVVTGTTTANTGQTVEDTQHTLDVPKELFMGGWIYILEDGGFGLATGDTTRIIDVNSDSGGTYWIFSVKPQVWTSIVSGIDYEIHYILHPEDINDVINDIIRFGTRSTLSSLTSDTDETVLERDVLVNGATAILKRRLAVGKGKFESAHVNEEAQYYEDKYLSGLVRQGYEPMRQVRNISVSN